MMSRFSSDRIRLLLIAFLTLGTSSLALAGPRVRKAISKRRIRSELNLDIIGSPGHEKGRAAHPRIPLTA